MTRAISMAGWVLAAGCFAGSPAPAQQAGQRVHRCVGAHGEIVFSGLPCTTQSGAVTPAAATPASAADAACPASPDELRERIAAAIARRDANALAGLLRWRGVGATEAGSRLAQLRQLARRPLLAIDVDGGAQSPGGSMRVRTGSNERDGVREHHFGLSLESGCHWLTW
jgi:hypothetical protein